MMPGKGPAPKPTASRARDALRRNVKKEIDADDIIRGPELPDTEDWHPQTVAWWETWRRSPLAKEWLDTDWDFLLDTALMHSTMWMNGQWTLAAEVRLRVAKLGATVEDRQRLRLSVKTAVDPVTNPGVAALDDYRGRLTGT